ncbi:hypothetical protein [Bradyrhizobium prioriisuperbiae]|uniref:hypothetical protein n=1 Tax=Bradyrhizobium prioriisuperbiae TaxID=2854389 RepID=UPI0028E9A41E|nr:hypothetical protein [Bradyrhizobium prioritasuperba]
MTPIAHGPLSAGTTGFTAAFAFDGFAADVFGEDLAVDFAVDLAGAAAFAGGGAAVCA